MGKTSWQVKQRYNKKHYKSFAAQLKIELAEEVNEFCKENELSKPQFIKLALEKLKENN